MEQFNLMFECEDCKNRFPVTSDQAPNSLTHKKEFKVNGKSIFLTYYDCPSCGRRHFVQIDDATTLSKLNEVRRMFVKLTVARRQNKEISKKQAVKFKNARQNLTNCRTRLMKKYTGKLIHDNETDSDFTLRFSV